MRPAAGAFFAPLGSVQFPVSANGLRPFDKAKASSGLKYAAMRLLPFTFLSRAGVPLQLTLSACVISNP